jgi:hypothetical protein
MVAAEHCQIAELASGCAMFLRSPSVCSRRARGWKI